MKLVEKQRSLEPGLKMNIPDSVIGLMSIVNFWEPRMDSQYSNWLRNQNKLEKLAQEKAKRGENWRKAHTLLDNLSLPKTRANLIRAYTSLGGKLRKYK